MLASITQHVCVCAYLNLKRAIKGHLEVLTVRVFSKHLLPCLLEQRCIEGVPHDHVTSEKQLSQHSYNSGQKPDAEMIITHPVRLERNFIS